MGSRSSVMYEVVLGQAKPGHTRCPAKRLGNRVVVEAGNQDQLETVQQPILIFYT